MNPPVMGKPIRQPVQVRPKLFGRRLAGPRSGLLARGIISRKQESDQEYEVVRGLSSPRLVLAHALLTKRCPYDALGERVGATESAAIKWFAAMSFAGAVVWAVPGWRAVSGRRRGARPFSCFVEELRWRQRFS